MGLTALGLILLYGLIGSNAKPQCTLITPNVLRLDSEETIIVDGHGTECNADIIIQDFPRKRFTLATSKVAVNRANQFFGSVKMTIPSTNLEKDLTKKQFVHVSAKAPGCSLEKVVLLSYQSGHIFIQTDQPLYTPEAKGAEIEKSKPENIFIVSSRYKILYTKTSRFFKPGMAYELMVLVTNPDGSPAHRVPVVAEPGAVRGTTQEDGTARLTLNTAADTDQLQITVTTTDPNLTNDQQAVGRMVATAYRSIGGNYLHISVRGGELKVGENATINFAIQNINPAVQRQIKQFNYVLLNKGKIIKVGTQEKSAGQLQTTMLMPVTKELIPTFRVLAYYIVPTATGQEMVADSVRLDVADNSMGTLLNKGRIMKVGAREKRAAQPLATMLMLETEEVIQSFRAVTYYIVPTGTGQEMVADTVRMDVADTSMGTLLNKGRIMKAGAQEKSAGQLLATMLMLVTEKFIPSFRILSYYTVPTAAGQETVTDSVRMDVADTFMGTVRKMVEKYDIGCTPGSGADAPGVFHDAGLTLQTSFGMATPLRSEPLCQPNLKRRRRSSALRIQDKDKKDIPT